MPCSISKSTGRSGANRQQALAHDHSHSGHHHHHGHGPADFGWASQDEMHDIADMAIRVNDFMCGMFAAIGIRLVDFKLEFGRLWENDFARIILADEISPDGCRLWDATTSEKLDKDRFRRDLGGEAEAYQEVARRLGLLPEGETNSVLDLAEHRQKRGK